VALGIVFSAAGLGSLVGMGGAAVLPRTSDRVFGWLVVALMAEFAVTLALMGLVSSTWVVAALMFATGVGNGYIGVIVMTSLQRMTSKVFLGRVMSLVVLAMVGLVPISQAFAGAIIRISPEALFMGSAVGFAALGVIAMIKRPVWTVRGEQIPTGPEVAEPAAALESV
jgi:MFS family permease